MRVKLKTVITILLVGLIFLTSCNSVDNGSHKDWADVSITVDQPSASNAGNRSVSPAGTLTALIMVIPASSSVITAETDFTNAYDGQLLNLTNNTVTLAVPLNESIQIVKKTFSTAMTLEATYGSSAVTSIGSSAAFTIDGSVTSKTVTILSSGGWSFVDGNGSVGLNKDSTRASIAGQLAVYNSTLFTGWTEESASNTVLEGYGQIRVAGWNGSSTWSFIDGNGADGLNYDVTKQAEHVNFAVYNSKLFLAWSEYNATKRQIHVRAFDGTNWVWTEGNGNVGSANGLNYQIAEDGRMPSLVVMGSNLYMAWEEGYSGGYQIRVRKWDGSTWSFVDGNLATGINQNTTKPARDPRLVVFNSKLYAVWREQNPSGFWQIRLSEWDGTSSWTLRDSGSDAGFNKDTSMSVDEFVLPFVHNSKLYIVWTELNSSSVYQVRVLEWDGTTPRFVDGDGVNGLNRDVTKSVKIPTLFEFNSKLHVAWSEPNAAGVYQLRVRQWDGNSTWTFVDGDGTNGLNKSSTNWAIFPSAVVFNSRLYLSFMEGLAAFAADPTVPDQVRVLEYR